MPFLAGEIVTAERLNLLQPKVYSARASTALNGPQTNGAVPGATVTFDSLTDNARVSINFAGAMRTSTDTSRCDVIAQIDGVGTLPRASFGQGPGNAADVATAAANVEESLGSAGSHTVRLVANLDTGQQVDVYTSLIVTVYEVV